VEEGKTADAGGPSGQAQTQLVDHVEPPRGGASSSPSGTVGEWTGQAKSLRPFAPVSRESRASPHLHSYVCCAAGIIRRHAMPAQGAQPIQCMESPSILRLMWHSHGGSCWTRVPWKRLRLNVTPCIERDECRRR